MGYVKIDGERIDGTVLKVTPGAFQVQTQLTAFWGLEGLAELRGKRGGREIRIRMVVHNQFASQVELTTVIANLQRLTLRHGQVECNTGAMFYAWENVTFHGFFPDEGNGSGPLLDVTGTLGGWWQQGTLVFHQIKPGRGFAG